MKVDEFRELYNGLMSADPRVLESAEQKAQQLEMMDAVENSEDDDMQAAFMAGLFLGLVAGRSAR